MEGSVTPFNVFGVLPSRERFFKVVFHDDAVEHHVEIKSRLSSF
jgi:hypothetical protein